MAKISLWACIHRFGQMRRSSNGCRCGGSLLPPVHSSLDQFPAPTPVARLMMQQCNRGGPSRQLCSACTHVPAAAVLVQDCKLKKRVHHGILHVTAPTFEPLAQAEAQYMRSLAAGQASSDAYHDRGVQESACIGGMAAQPRLGLPHMLHCAAVATYRKHSPALQAEKRCPNASPRSQ